MRRYGVALLLLASVISGALLWRRWPRTDPALGCDPSEVHLDDDGVARCGPGKSLSAPQVLTAKGHLDLNRATADELAVIPGVGPKLAKAIVEARAGLDGGFHDWEEVDRVSGVGDSRLDTLKATAEIR